MLITAFVLGFLGSLHCVGMCGPLVLALPVKNINSSFFVGRILYNIGRICTYALIGLLVGSVGKGFSFFVSQQTLSIVTGGLIIFVAVITVNKPRFTLPGTGKINQILRQKIGKYMGRQSLESQFTFGLFNGLLPCGFVYFALTSSLAAGSPTGSAGFMAAFGLGTFPAMFAVTLSKSLFSKEKLNVFTSFNTYIALFIGVLFIVRGLDLGIPLLSPKMNAQQEVQCCHHRK